MRLNIAIVALLLLCMFNACKKEDAAKTIYQVPAPLTGQTYSSTELAGFKEITINGNYNNGTIKKLPKTTFIYLVDTLYPALTRQLDSIISEVNAQTDTNLVVKRSTDSNLATIKVHLTNRTTFKVRVPASVPYFNTAGYEYDGLALPTWNSQGVLTAENVFVDMQLSASDTANQFFLLRHEMMHSFGFLGHVSLVVYTGSILYYFRITPYTTTYSYFEKRMIHLLYNPAIKPGMREVDLNLVLVTL